MDSMFVMEQTGNTWSPGTASVAKTEETGSIDSSRKALAAVTKQAGVALQAVTEQATNTAKTETALNVTLIPLHFFYFHVHRTTKTTIFYMPG